MARRPGLLWSGGLAVLAAVGLAACAVGPDLTYVPTPPDPPPIPSPKPAAPGGAPARAAPPAPAAVTRAPLVPARAAPAPVAAPAPAPAPAPAGTLVAYGVQAGDTVFGIARRLAVPLRSVIDANGLVPPYKLRVGQVLRVPNPRRHVVRKGDTIYAVSRRYGVEPSALVRLNRIRPPFTIAPGQDLTLPVAVRAPQAPVQVASRVASRAPEPAAQVDPAPAAQPAPEATPAAAPALAPAPAVAAVPDLGKARRLAAIPKPPPRAGAKFLWPAEGRVIGGYGPREGGFHNDGINIAAPRGAPVRAAENGVVAYVGNELRGFGNLILVKHAGGWVTAYAHTDESLVARGQTVERGQVIARVGSSGSVSRPQLHFEIRQGTRAVDPRRLLGPQRAQAG